MIDYSKYDDQLLEIRRKIHAFPELGFDLYKTSSLVRDILEQNNIKYSEYLNGSGIVAEIGNYNENSRVIALGADIDALPIKEETDLDFKSKNGCMHACGHDVHTAMLLITAIILKENEDSLNGVVKLVFQPAEESDGGAKPLIDKGILDNPKVDCMLGQHVISAPGFEKSGLIHFKSGPMLASSDKLYIEFIGKGGHAAQPHTSIDPITMAISAISAYQLMIAKEVDPLDDKLLTIASIQGGDNFNTVPDKVIVKGIIRTFNEHTRKYIKERVREITECIAKAMRGTCLIDFIEGYPTLYNDPKLTSLVLENTKKIFPKDLIDEKGQKLMGSEDFAYYGYEIPSLFTFIDMPKYDKDGIIHPSHSSKFDIDEEQMINGVKYFVENAIFLLNHWSTFRGGNV